MSFSYQSSFFFAVFFVFVPVTLVLLTRRVHGRRKLLWALLAVPFSWLACVALVLLVPPSPESGEGRTPWQQRTWVVAVLALLTVVSPLASLWAGDPLEAPLTVGNRPAESAYQVVADRGYHRRIHEALKEKHGGLLSWYLFFSALLMTQHDNGLHASPTVAVAFPDNSKIVYDITSISSGSLRLEVGSATDGAGNLIHQPADVDKYSGDRGRFFTDDQLKRFVAYLKRLDVPVSLETTEGSPARWQCRGARESLSCRVFADRPAAKLPNALP